jgi:hypothetical protein
MLRKSTDGKSRVQRRHHEFLKDSNFKRASIDDEVLPQVFVYTVNEIPARAYVRRLAKKKVY